MSWREWVALLGDEGVTAKEFGEAHGISESKARGRLRKAVMADHLVCRKRGTAVVYKVRRVSVDDSDFAKFCGHNIQHFCSLPEACSELPLIFLGAVLEVANKEELSDRIIYTVETKASIEVAKLAVSIGINVETKGDLLLIVRTRE